MASDLVWHALAPGVPRSAARGNLRFGVLYLARADPPGHRAAEPCWWNRSPGGWGATASQDGQHGLVSVGDGETYTIPVEVAEQRYGIRVERFGFDVVPGAGAGRRRGGRGLVREYRILQRRRAAHGRLGPPPVPALGSGGGPQARRTTSRSCGTASRSAVGRQGVPAAAASRGPGPAGDRHRRWIRRPARTRIGDLVRRDLRDELITPAEAADSYGLVHDAPARPGPFG